MSITPRSPDANARGKLRTWVTSQWKLHSFPGQLSAEINTDIAGRIQSIFSEIEALKTVRVQVSAGVVTLSGTVPTAEDVKRAEAIAGRVSGVVTVQNDVTRDLDVSTNLTPALGEFGQDIRGLAQALPLLGVALAN